jgi:hypothetical protein
MRLGCIIIAFENRDRDEHVAEIIRSVEQPSFQVASQRATGVE